MRNEAFDIVEQGSLREEALSFQIGDTVSVHCRIQEGNKGCLSVSNAGVACARRTSVDAVAHESTAVSLDNRC